MTRGFQVIKRDINVITSRYYTDQYHSQLRTKITSDPDAAITIYFRCPVCKSFKQWIVFELESELDNNQKTYFRVTSLPGDGLGDIDELPQSPPSLQTADRQAIRATDASAHLAAAAMFRRALQVITRDILGAKPGNLSTELNELVGKSYNGVVITDNFAKVGYIVKEAGNQGAHPDKDPDLLDFTLQDAQDLQRIFMELVRDLFIVPEAIKKAKEDFLLRRKIIIKPWRLQISASPVNRVFRR